MDALLRPALTDDAGLVAALQMQVWQQAYAEILPASVLLGDQSAQTERWQERIAGGGPVVIAFEGATPVGFTAVSDEADGGAGEIELLLVLPRWARRGHGGRLLAAAALSIRGAGANQGRWWAPETDVSIERFLAGAGWAPDGTARVLDTGESTFTEIRYTGGLDLLLV